VKSPTARGERLHGAFDAPTIHECAVAAAEIRHHHPGAHARQHRMTAGDAGILEHEAGLAVAPDDGVALGEQVHADASAG
jgi:hypothetical protein